MLKNYAIWQQAPQGQKLKSHCQKLIQDWDRIRSETLNLESKIEGKYSIGCHISVARYTLPSFLPKILQDNPKLEINLKHDLSRKITEEVVRFQTDIGILVNPVEHPDLVIKEILKDEVTLWRKNPPSSLQRVEKEPGILIYDPDLIQAQTIKKKLKRSNFQFAREISSSSLEVITRLTASGAGVGVIPSRVAKLLTKPSLVKLDSAPQFQDRICLIYRADAPKTQAMKYIISEIVSATKTI